MREPGLTPAMRTLVAFLESRTGQTLSDSRIWRIETSLKPVLKAHGLRTLDALVAAIDGEPEGPLALAATNALLNNETSFYRDAHIFQLLMREVIPAVMEKAERRSDSKLLRIWCAGCSTGQEAFTLAMIIQAMMAERPGWHASILATDVSSQAIARARSGLFPQIDVQRGLPINELLRWFEPVGEEWQISRQLRDMIDFRVDNLVAPSAPAGEYDIIFCRNVLLYFPAERKRQIFETLARHCRMGGYLLLGAGETVIGHTADFSASPQFRGIYERMDSQALGACGK